jgi:hypothetical protein
MNCHRAISLLRYCEKSFQNAVTRCATIQKEQVSVIKSSINEPLSVIHPLVQSNNGRNLISSKVWKIELWSMQRISIFNATFIVRAGKCKEFP